MGIDKGILSALADHQKKVRGPHFIFSVERPLHPQNNEIKMGHDQILNSLFNAGYDAHEIRTQYGNPQKSIIIYQITPEVAEELHQLVAKLGQGHSIYSDGLAHEMRFHHGAYAGRSHYGQGTSFWNAPPGDAYHTLPGAAAHFSHNFDYKSVHMAKQLGNRGASGKR